MNKHKKLKYGNAKFLPDSDYTFILIFIPLSFIDYVHSPIPNLNFYPNLNPNPNT